MKTPLILSAILLLSSCGAFKFWEPQSDFNERKAASTKGLVFNQAALLEDLETKLLALHSYYVIGQKNLKQFDRDLADTPLDELYRSETYLSLLAVRSQAEEIEHEILDLQKSTDRRFKMNQSPDSGIFKKAVERFSQKSQLSSMSMENLSFALGINPTNFKSNRKSISEDQISKEYAALERSREFRIYEKNIEHQAHLLEVKLESDKKKFYPSTTKSGNITGNEFPAKVWSLTFDDGPSKETSHIVLKNLTDKGLKATFFQLTSKVEKEIDTAHSIRDAGMEIASHSFNHLELTKVSTSILNKEITQAVKDIERLQDVKIKFFRLPYGAGVSVPHIRQKIADNGLIHVFWNIDTLDWMAQTPDKIVERTKSLMQKTKNDAGVILFHDIHVRTTIASAEIMDYLKQDQRRVCSLDEIVTQMNEGKETVCPAN